MVSTITSVMRSGDFLVLLHVAVALAAPGNRAELDHLLTVVDEWQAPSDARLEELRQHGDRVRRHGGMFP